MEEQHKIQVLSADIFQLFLGLSVITSSAVVITCIMGHYKLRHTYAYWFIANLAAGDILHGIGHMVAAAFRIHSSVASNVTTYKIMKGLPCITLGVVFSFSGVHTHLCMLGVALERYLTINLPLSYYYYITDSTCMSAIVVITITSLVFPAAIFIPGLSIIVRAQEEARGNFPEVSGTDERSFPSTAGVVVSAGGANDTRIDECTTTTIVRKGFSIAFECTLLLISVLTITLYLHLSIIAKSHLKRLREQHGHIQLMFLEKNTKASMVTVKIFLTFACFQWPSRIINMLVAIGFGFLGGSIPQYFFHGCTLLVSICNPFIYSYFNKDFSAAFRKLVLRRRAVEIDVREEAADQVFGRTVPLALRRAAATAALAESLQENRVDVQPVPKNRIDVQPVQENRINVH